MEAIIEENLARMFGCDDGDMQHHLIRESMGSYDFHNGRPCMPAHFIYCPKTGRIGTFGNPYHQTKREQSYSSRFSHGIYVLAHMFTPLSNVSREEIVGLNLDSHNEIDFDIKLHVDLAHLVLVETAKKFNKIRKKLKRVA